MYANQLFDFYRKKQKIQEAIRLLIMQQRQHGQCAPAKRLLSSAKRCWPVQALAANGLDRQAWIDI